MAWLPLGHKTGNIKDLAWGKENLCSGRRGKRDLTLDSPFWKVTAEAKTVLLDPDYLAICCVGSRTALCSFLASIMIELWCCYLHAISWVLDPFQFFLKRTPKFIFQITGKGCSVIICQLCSGVCSYRMLLSDISVHSCWLLCCHQSHNMYYFFLG